MLKILIYLCLFRKGANPSQLPFSKITLFFLIAIYCVVGYVSLTQFSLLLFKEENIPAPENAFALGFVQSFAVLVGVAILLSLLYFFLMKQNKTNRFHKILMAWFGTDILLELVGFVLPSITILEIIFLMWNIFIKANILKTSLEITMNRSLLMALALIFIHSITLVEFFWIGLHFI